MKKTELTLEEKWENITLANNFIFYKVMHTHPDACKHLLELLLHIKIENMEMANEETLIIDHDAKAIRLDVYVKDSDHVYDVEVQVVNTHDLPERARYYQSVMDVDMLKPGQTYDELKDSYVIFICMDDIFEMGLPLYTFKYLCKEDKKLELKDRTFKLFFIAPLCAKMIKDEKAKNFFDFFISNKTGDDYTSNLHKYVEDARHNTQWRNQYMTVEMMQNYAFKDGKKQGVLEGANRKAEEDAVNLLKEGIAEDVVSRCVGLPLEKVQELAKEIKK